MQRFVRLLANRQQGSEFMAWDTSAYCPGGTGKKIKHCMCRDISGELQKIWQAREGNQRIAALERIDRVLATKAHRPCLLSLKISMLLEMGDMQRLEETVATFVKAVPDNALAHVWAARLEVRKDQPRAAVDALQEAYYRYEGRELVDGELLDVTNEVGSLLARHGQLLAARAHLLLCVAIDQEHSESLENLTQVSVAKEVPSLFKCLLHFVPSPEHVPWEKAFNTAYQHCISGAWKVGLKLFEALDHDYPGQAAVLKNIAVARSSLGNEGSAEAWHRCAAAKSIDFQGAVNAEALAQLLDYHANQRTVAAKKITVNVTDADALQEKLLSCKRIISTPDDPDLQPTDSPPPKGAFGVIDRPFPGESDTLTLENLPRSQAQVVLFGKETDREARLELVAAEGERLDLTRQLFSEIAPDLLIRDSEVEEIVETWAVETIELFPLLRFPPETPLLERKRLSDEAVSAAFQEKWPRMPLLELDGKAPRDVAGDPAYQVRLAAALLVVEQWDEMRGEVVNVDRLRETLGVPLPEPIDPTDCEIFAFDPHEWHWIEVEKLTDEQLQKLYANSVACSARPAIRRAGHELLRRGGEGTDLARVAGTMAELESDLDRSVELLQQAQALEQKAGKSPVRWFLAELPLRLVRGEGAEIGRLLDVIQRRHIQEPGVREALYGILTRFGLITEDGELATPAKQTAASEPAAAAEPKQKLWTPDSAGASSGSEQTSKLWIPGTD